MDFELRDGAISIHISCLLQNKLDEYIFRVCVCVYTRK